MLNLIWFHRLLIGCAVVFCASFGVYELLGYNREGGIGKLVLAIVFGLLAVGLFWYLRNLSRVLKLRTDRK